MEDEDRIDALLALAAEHSTAISENIARQKVLLNALEKFGPATGQAVMQIAKDAFLSSAAVLDKKTAESTAAAAQRLAEASAAFRWKTITVATLVSVVGAMAIAAATWAATTYQRDELAQLSNDIRTMRQHVADLEQRGGRAKLNTCTGTDGKGRLCILVDEEAGRYGPEDATYFVIKGY